MSAVRTCISATISLYSVTFKENEEKEINMVLKDVFEKNIYNAALAYLVSLVVTDTVFGL